MLSKSGNFFLLVMLVCVAGCCFSPISKTEVSVDTLIKQWEQFQNRHQADQQRWKNDIAKANDDAAAVQAQVASNLFYHLIQFLNDPHNGGVLNSVGTALISALTVGLHLNNQRLDRKIAHPEIDDPDATTSTQKSKAASASTPLVVGRSRLSDVALQAALDSTAVNLNH